VCTRSPEGQPYPGLHQEKHGHQVEGGDPASLLCSGETPPGALHPALEPSAGLKGAYKKAGEGLFTRACSDRTRGNSFKLKEGRCRSDTRKKFCTMRVVKHWNRLSREAVDAPSLEVFKARLGGALSNLV